MQPGSPVTADLVPPALAGAGLAHYRLLLPLHHAESDTHSPWSAFLPDEVEDTEQLRNIDLSELRHCAADAGRDMSGWDSCRGAVSADFVGSLRDALEEFVPAHARWTLARWQGYRLDLDDTTPVTIGDRECAQQVLDLKDTMDSIRELGMPDFLWSSTPQFGWGAPLYPDWGVMTVAAQDYIRHVAPRGFQAFSVPPDAALPDNLGD